MSTIIIRPSHMPPVRVLEVDGPRGRFVERGEGSYYLATNNHPVCDPISSFDGYAPDSRLKDWDRPFWEIYQLNDGAVQVHACRPSIQEAMRGDLHGAWGSIITPKSHRRAMRIALRIARRLCTCNPMEGIRVDWRELAHLWRIESDIPVFEIGPQKYHSSQKSK